MARRLRWIAVTAGLLAALPGCGGRHPPLPTVERVELDRYLGTWYEIARYPAPFQEGCVATSADYSRRDGGGIRVLNSCRVETLDGELREAEGRARIVDPESNAKLKVTFFWPFWGDYWVLGLGPDYEWALVGETFGAATCDTFTDAPDGPCHLQSDRRDVAGAGL
jgi:lipocalin